MDALQASFARQSIGNTKPLFTRAHPPAPPSISPAPTLYHGALSHQPAAGKLGRQPGGRRGEDQSGAWVPSTLRLALRIARHPKHRTSFDMTQRKARLTRASFGS